MWLPPPSGAASASPRSPVAGGAHGAVVTPRRPRVTAAARIPSGRALDDGPDPAGALPTALVARPHVVKAFGAGSSSPPGLRRFRSCAGRLWVAYTLPGGEAS